MVSNAAPYEKPPCNRGMRASLPTSYYIHMRFLLTLLLTAICWSPARGEACHGTPPCFTISDGEHLEARAQTGIRLKGHTTNPRVVAVRQIAGLRAIPLRGTTKVTDMRDTRPVWQRMFGGAPELEEIPAKNQLFIKPEEVLESDLEYEVTIQDGERRSTVRIRFKGGLQKC